MIRIAIHGAAGRMGQRLVALAAADPQLEIAAALEASGHSRLGQDAGEVAAAGKLGAPITSSLPDVKIDVVIDFSLPAGLDGILAACRERRIPLVTATTGLSLPQQQAVERAADTIAVLQSPNMSLAVNLLMKLSAVAAGALKDHPAGADVEIVERHHRFKEDAPSGTALKFGEIIAAAMGHTRHQHGREGRTGARRHEEIGYHAVRSGDNPGEHTIIFGLLGETIELSVRATNRDSYAHGALAAAKFLAGKPPGMYGMEDVLGL